MKLDRKRPFGQVFGQASHAYEQDGKLFDHEGEEVVSESKSAAPPKPAEVPEPIANTIKVDGQDVQLDGMDAAALHELAMKVGATVHPRAGAVKVIAALVAWQAVQVPDQLDSQLNG